MKENNKNKCVYKKGTVLGKFVIVELSNKKPGRPTVQAKICAVEKAASLPKNQDSESLIVNCSFCPRCKQGVFARLIKTQENSTN